MEKTLEEDNKMNSLRTYYKLIQIAQKVIFLVVPTLILLPSLVLGSDEQNTGPLKFGILCDSSEVNLKLPPNRNQATIKITSKEPACVCYTDQQAIKDILEKEGERLAEFVATGDYDYDVTLFEEYINSDPEISISVSPGGSEQRTLFCYSNEEHQAYFNQITEIFRGSGRIRILP